MLKISKAQIAHLISAPIVLGITVGSAWVARHFPGLPTLNNEEISAFALVVGGTAAGTALHYLKGLREWEALEAAGVISTEAEGSPEEPLPPTAIPTPSENAQALESLPDPEAPPAIEGGAPGGADAQG